MCIDEMEYVCEECGSIYDVSELKFVRIVYDFDKKQDEYDKLLEGIIMNDNIKNKDNKMKKVIEYDCPVCKYRIIDFDRREYNRN